MRPGRDSPVVSKMDHRKFVIFTLMIVQVYRPAFAQLYWSPEDIECVQENPCQNGGVCLNLRRPGVGRELVTCSVPSCVKVFTKETSDWQGAVTTCSQSGGHLVSFENIEEQEHIFQFILDKFADSKPWDNPDDGGFWTSGRYYPQQGIPVWFWHSNSSVVRTSQWPDIPADAVGDQCLSIRLTSADGPQLEAQPCNLKKGYLCEIPKENLIQDWTYACHCPANYYGYNCDHYRGMIKTSVCEGDNFSITCPEDLLIQINEADFDPADGKCAQHHAEARPTAYPCRGADIASWLEKQCNNRNSCSSEVTPNFSGKQTCPERTKVLNVVYQCLDKPAFTKFPCERTNVTLNCDGKDEQILIEYANYGRMNRTICIAQELERCRAMDSLSIVAGKCNGKQRCGIQTENSVFGDPCNGYFKYLETRYRCVADAGDFIYPPVPGWVPPTTPAPKTHCGARTKLGYNWPRTAFGQEAHVECLVDNRYSAFWLCSDENDDWDSAGPNNTNCPSPWVSGIENKLQNLSISTADLAQSVFDQVNSETGEEVTSEVLRQTVVIMDALLDRQKLQLENNSDEGEVQKTLIEFNRVMLELGSGLMQRADSNRGSGEAEGNTINIFNITGLLESCSLLLAERLTANRSEEKIETEDINLEVTKVSPTVNRVKRVRFPLPRLKTKGRVYNYEVDLPTVLPKAENASKDEEITMSILVYDTLDTLLQGSLEVEPSRHESSMVSPSSSRNESNVTSIIASVVIGVTMRVGDKIVNDLGGQEINFTLKHKNMSLEGETTCVFWDHFANDMLGGWSREGCRKTSARNSSGETGCACTHLTNFAILMDVQGAHTEISEGHTIALELISIVGCTISIVCLAVCILVFSCFKDIRNVRTSIHRNLCLALMVAELLFLFGVNLTEMETLCTAVAILLHYFFLTAFVWMCLEGVQLYIMLVHVFHTDNKVLPYYLVGYGLPAVVVSVAAGVHSSGYGTEHYCWLSTEDGFIWSFAGPVLFIIFVNVVFLTRSLRVAYSKSASMKKETQKNPNIRSWIKGGLTLTFLLGTTWVVGFAFIGEQTVVMAYIFTGLNSLQGLFIFFFHCLGNERIQREVARSLAKQPWLPKCIRKRLLMKTATSSGVSTAHSQVEVNKRKKDIDDVAKPADVFLIEDTKRKSSTFFNNPQIKLEAPEPARYSWLHNHGAKSNNEYISNYPEPDYT